MITLKELAHELGLSPPTVSRALQNSSRVSLATRMRVQEAAARADYIPNQAASGLRTRHSKTIGVLVPTMDSSYWPEILQGIQRKANQHDYTVIVHASGSLDSITSNVNFLLRNRVDGVLRISHNMDYDAKVMKRFHEDNTILVDIDFDGFPFTSHRRIQVDFSNEDGACLATQHLIDLGHRNIVHINGPTYRSRTARMRRRGYEIAMQEAGISIPPYVIPETDYSFESGLLAASGLFEDCHFPIGIIACSDDIAAAVIQIAWERKYKVPQDISVIGFGDELIAKRLSIPLTTIKVPAQNCGQEAFTQFYELRESDRITSLRITLPVELIVRNSTAPPHMRP